MSDESIRSIDRRDFLEKAGGGFSGAASGFQDHPNVEIVAVSDLAPERRNGLMEACRCGKSYESLEKLVKDPTIEAVFVATDASSHARHCMDVLNHDKHVMTAVPAVLGSVGQAEQLVETVQETGMKYMMSETNCFRADCHAMRQIYRSCGFGRLVYSEGEYFYYGSTPTNRGPTGMTTGLATKWRCSKPARRFLSHAHVQGHPGPRH